MIILNRIKLNNFLSHSETVIDFKKDEKLLIDGKSGSGKSSIPEAIIWCLYGEGRSDNRNLVKHGTKNCYVVIDLQDGANLYRIKRTTTDKAKNTLEVLKDDNGNWRPIDRVGIKDTQDWIINDLLHASYELFINSIAYPQDNINNFVRQTASKRKDLLLEIANVKNFDNYYNRAKDYASTVSEEIATVNGEISSLVTSSEISQKTIIDEKIIEEENKKLKAELDSHLLKIENIKVKRALSGEVLNSIKKLENDLAEKKNRAEKIKIEIKRKNETKEQYEAEDYEKIKEDVEKGRVLRKELESIEQIIREDYERTSKLNALLADRPSFHNYDKDVSELNRQLIPLIKDSGKCPAGDDCPFIIPIKNQISYLENQIIEKTKKKEEYEVEESKFKAKIDVLSVSKVSNEVRAHYDQLRSSTGQLGAQEALLAVIESRRNALPALKIEILGLEKELDELFLSILTSEGELEAKKKESDPEENARLNLEESGSRFEATRIEAKIKENERIVSVSLSSRENIKRSEDKISELKKGMKKLEKKKESLLLIKEAFGSKGLKTVVIDYLIPRLEDKINEILSKLSDFRVRLDTQKSTADGESTIEGLYINIINDRGEELEFSNYSGGERLKITVAISEALASLQKVGFRILDELFVGLDDEATEGFADVMNKLNERFDQMICISHLRTIKDLFEKKIVISKVNGASKVN